MALEHRQAAARLLHDAQETLGAGAPVLAPMYFYSQRESLPHCGMPEYVRAAASTATSRASPVNDAEPTVEHSGTPGRKVCYAEGDRIVCSVAYTVCPCELLHPHHLHGMRYEKVMCNVPEDSALVTDERCVSLLAESNGYSL